jgi:uncharacterized protein
VLGLTHNWYGIPPTAVADTQKVFVISWLVIVTMLLLASARLPIIYGLLFLLIDVCAPSMILGCTMSASSYTPCSVS